MCNNNIITRDCLKYDVFEQIDKNIIFEKDNEQYKLLRYHIDVFIENTILNHKNNLILEIGPNNKPNEKMSKENTVETLDICNNEYITYIADITKDNNIPKERFDVIYCIDVLEHTYEPWEALNQIYKLLKKNGILYLSLPFQFRIHGPIPDCYRISEYGLKYLLKKYNFEIIKMDALIDNERQAFPIHYNIICKK